MNIDWKRFWIALAIVYCIGVCASMLMISLGIDTTIRCIVCALIGVAAAIVYPLPTKKNNAR